MLYSMFSLHIAYVLFACHSSDMFFFSSYFIDVILYIHNLCVMGPDSQTLLSRGLKPAIYSNLMYTILYIIDLIFMMIGLNKLNLNLNLNLNVCYAHHVTVQRGRHRDSKKTIMQHYSKPLSTFDQTFTAAGLQYNLIFHSKMLFGKTCSQIHLNGLK